MVTNSKVSGIIGSRIMVRPHLPEKTDGGLVLPKPKKIGQFEMAPPTIRQGEIIQVGQGHITSSGERVPLELKVGDTVFFESDHCVLGQLSNGEVIVVMNEDDVLWYERRLRPENN
jgi:chaperonin GroES